MRKPAKKSAKMRSPKSKSAPATITAKHSQPSPARSATRKTSDTPSKQERVLAMLRSPDGTTVAAMMQATGWQQHSVRGFLAGTVRKRLKLKLQSTKVDGTRIYRIGSETLPKANRPQSKRRAA